MNSSEVMFHKDMVILGLKKLRNNI